MAPNDRQERRLARQRGAGTREIKNANFGFTIGVVPLAAKKSTGRRSKTPQALPARPSTRKTPARPSANTQATRSTARRNAKVPNDGAAATAQGTVAASNYKTPTVTGKRKRGIGQTTKDQEEDELEADDAEHRSTAKRTFITQAPRQTPAATGVGGEYLSRAEGKDELEVADADHTIMSNDSTARPGSAAPSTSKRAASGPPTATPAAHVSKPGQISTPFIDPALLAARKSTAKGKSKLRNITPSKTPEQENPVYEPGMIISFKPRTPLAPVANMLPLSAGPSTLQAPAPPMNDISPLFQPGEEADAEGSPERISLHSHIDSASEEDELTPAPTTVLSQNAKRPNQDRKRRSTPKKSSKLATGARPRAQTAKNKKGNTASSTIRRGQSPSTYTRQRRANSPVTVPITIYRPTNVSTLYSTQAPDADPLGSEPVPTLNAVDVLAQISGEITKTFIESYDETGEANVWASDGVRKRQKRAVARFGGILADALFGLTGAVQAGVALKTRVASVKKKRQVLREELVALRMEREDVGREMDGVRADYAKRKASHEQRVELSGLIENVRAFMEKREEKSQRGDDGEKKEQNAMDRSLERLRDDVMVLVGEKNGLLARVQGLNERMQAVAEGIERDG